MTFLRHLTTTLLRYAGDCTLLGITPDQQLYVEETYGDAESELYLAQHRLGADGALVASVDEAYGQQSLQPLPLPADLITPQIVTHSRTLRYVGGRLRGLREEERAADWVQPLTLPEKMALCDYFKRLKEIHVLVASPMMILGIAESVPLAEVVLDNDGSNQLWVCRRVRIAIALTPRQTDADNEPFDYDTIPLYLIHLYDPANSAPLLHDSWAGLGKNDLDRPMSLLAHGDCLYIGNGGMDEQLSSIQVFRIQSDA
jgi:hypothetical protein